MKKTKASDILDRYHMMRSDYEYVVADALKGVIVKRFGQNQQLAQLHADYLNEHEGD